MFWLSIIKLALEVYKAIKGVPNAKQDQVKSHLMDKIAEVKVAARAGSESGDYAALEAIINRTAS